MSAWIQTHTGKRFDLERPTVDMICLEDIAHALSLLCRFTGHCRHHYSVAQHSVMVVDIVGQRTSASRGFMRQALLHDAAEAYLGDVATPLKRLLPDYQVLEDRVWRAIAERFRVEPVLSPHIKAADLTALVTERRDLLGKSPEPWHQSIEVVRPLSAPIERWTRKAAKNQFLRWADMLDIQ